MVVGSYTRRKIGFVGKGGGGGAKQILGGGADLFYGSVLRVSQHYQQYIQLDLLMQDNSF